MSVAAAWFVFLQRCKRNNIKMSQTIAAKRMGIKRSTFSHAINYGPSDTVLLRFCLLSGVRARDIDPALNHIEPVLLAS